MGKVPGRREVLGRGERKAGGRELARGERILMKAGKGWNIGGEDCFRPGRVSGTADHTTFLGLKALHRPFWSCNSDLGGTGLRAPLGS